ncbi:MAG: ATP-binding protein [Actinomycetota bacterium]|nr:ATP-binding protein [Actinomycetota bacterium]
MPDIIVQIPARPEFVHVLRSAVASVAARLDFTYDAIDDLRIAVDEACAHLLGVSPVASKMTLRMTPDGHDLVVLAFTDAEPQAWPPPGAKQTLAWQVLSALADEVVFEREGLGPALRLTKRGLEIT